VIAGGAVLTIIPVHSEFHTFELNELQLILGFYPPYLKKVVFLQLTYVHHI